MSTPQFTGESRFVNSLPPRERSALLASCRRVNLPIHASLYESEQNPQQVYFITSGMASIVTSMPDGATVEVGVAGREGIVGSLHLLGPTLISTRSMMQLGGTALAIPFAQMSLLFEEHPSIHAHILEWTQMQSASLGQIAACHRLHLAEERLARWLLMVQDRVESDLIELTQEFLADMLGSRRTTVTKAAGVLEREGCIEYRRGHLRIIDRDKLIGAACVCYPIVQRMLLRLYQAPAAPGADGQPPTHHTLA